MPYNYEAGGIILGSSVGRCRDHAKGPFSKEEEHPISRLFFLEVLLPISSDIPPGGGSRGRTYCDSISYSCMLDSICFT